MRQSTTPSASRPPQTASHDIATSILNDMVAEVLWYQGADVNGNARKTHTRVEVTHTPDNLFHAVATLRALQGRVDLTREQLRTEAAQWFGRVCPRPSNRKQPALRGRELQRLRRLFPFNTKAPFVEHLTCRRPMDSETGEKPHPTSPWGYGMERAARELQRARTRARRPRLEWLRDAHLREYMHDDQWDKWRATGSTTRPKGKRFGARMPEYVYWFGERLLDQRSFGTLYDLEALAWQLPEATGFLLYYMGSDKTMHTLSVGPAPPPGGRPYEMLWSGNDKMLFWPMVALRDKTAAQAAADALPAPAGTIDWRGNDMFKKLCIARQTFDDVRSVAEAAQGAPATDAQMAERLAISAFDAALLRQQRNSEHMDGEEMKEAFIRQRLDRKRTKERTRYTAVSVAMSIDNCKNCKQPLVKRHRREYVQGRDETRDERGEDVLALINLSAWEMARVATQLGDVLTRLPTAAELSAHLGVEERLAGRAFDQAQEELRTSGDLHLESYEFEWCSTEPGQASGQESGQRSGQCERETDAYGLFISPFAPP